MSLVGTRPPTVDEWDKDHYDLLTDQVVEISENIMHLTESTPDISIEINGCIV